MNAVTSTLSPICVSIAQRSTRKTVQALASSISDVASRLNFVTLRRRSPGADYIIEHLKGPDASKFTLRRLRWRMDSYDVCPGDEVCRYTCAVDRMHAYMEACDCVRGFKVPLRPFNPITPLHPTYRELGYWSGADAGPGSRQATLVALASRSPALHLTASLIILRRSMVDR